MFNIIISYIKPHVFILSCGSLCAILGAISSSIIPIFLGCGIDDLTEEIYRQTHDKGRLTASFCEYFRVDGDLSKELWSIYWASCSILIALVNGVLTYYKRNLVIGVSRNIEYTIRKNLFHHMLSLDRGFYHDNRSGDTLSRFNSDIDNIRSLYGPGYMYLFDTLFMILFSFLFMVNISTIMTLVIMIPVIILSVGVFFISKRFYRASKAVQEQLAVMTSWVEESYRGVRVIHAFNLRDRRSDGLKEIGTEHVSRKIRLARVSAHFRPFFFFVHGVAITLLLVFGGLQVLDGYQTIGDLATFFIYLEILMMPLMAAGWGMSLFQQGIVGMNRINRILDRVSALPQPKNIYPLPEPEIFHVDKISFRYSADGPSVLKDIDFSIRRGEVLGILGTTGAGKSTLLHLLSRFYDPTRGSIKMNGVDIRNYNLHDYRWKIGVVLQSPLFFSTTIRENLLLSSHDPHVSQEKLDWALAQSQFALDLQTFPKGLNEFVGERGVTLSGGQRQRLSLAQLLIRDAKIWILDDPFSAIDSRTENEIHSGILPLFHEKISLFVSQRIATLRTYATRILVIDRGHVVGLGTAEELGSSCELYKNIRDHQNLESELKKHDAGQEEKRP